MRGCFAVAGPDAIKRALTIVQLVMSFVVYGGYMVMSRLVSASFIASLALPKTIWLLLFPPTWFAS